MLQQFPQLLGYKADNLINKNQGGYNFIFNVNAKPATIDTILQQGDNISLLPPISGASKLCSSQSLEKWNKFCRCRKSGAVMT
jgi:hypothetical protein